jgi:very-short-patch-repair endonuclease
LPRKVLPQTRSFWGRCPLGRRGRERCLRPGRVEVSVMPGKRTRAASSVLRGRGLRSNLSLPEALLWRELKAGTWPYKLRRQHRWGPYVLDFYCAEVGLCVEIDDDQHRGTTERDNARDAALIGAGICVLRIAASEVFSSPEGCVAWMQAACEEVAHCRRDGEPAWYSSRNGFRSKE